MQYTNIVILINKIDSMVAPLEEKYQSSGLYLTGEDQWAWVNQQFSRQNPLKPAISEFKIKYNLQG
jgi:hypothetical protein